MAVSVPPTRPGKRVRRLTPTCSAAVGRGGADPSVTVPAMREERSRPQAELRRPLTARTAVVTASSQVVGRVTTLLLTVAGTAVVTRAVGENGFADWGTVLMVTAMFAFLLDPGFAPVVVRRLAEGGDEAPSPAALLRVRLVFSAIAFALVVALVVALRGTAPIVLAVVLAAQLFPRAVVMNAGTWLQAQHRLHVQTFYEALTVGAGLVLLLIAAALDAPPGVLAAVGVLAPAVLLAVLMWRQLELLVPGSRAQPARRPWADSGGPARGGAAGRGDRPGVDLHAHRRRVRQRVPRRGRGGGVHLRVPVHRAGDRRGGDRRGHPAADAGRARRRCERGPASVFADMLSLVTFIGSIAGLVMIGLARPVVRVIGGDDLEGAVEPLVLLAPACAALFANFYMGYVYVAARRAARYLLFNVVGPGLERLPRPGVHARPRRHRGGARDLGHRDGRGAARRDLVLLVERARPGSPCSTWPPSWRSASRARSWWPPALSRPPWRPSGRGADRGPEPAARAIWIGYGRAVLSSERVAAPPI